MAGPDFDALFSTLPDAVPAASVLTAAPAATGAPANAPTASSPQLDIQVRPWADRQPGQATTAPQPSPTPNGSSSAAPDFDAMFSALPDAKPAAPAPSLLSKALEPITSYPATYAQMNADARNQMATGIDQIKQGFEYAASPTPEGATGSEGLVPIAKGIGNTALGAINYVTSPINAALHTVVGKPIEENTGIPAPYSEFAASLAIPGMGMTKAQGVIDASNVVPTTEQIYNAAGKGYDAIRDANVVIDPTHTSALADNIQAALKQAGYRDIANTPGNGVFRIVDELRDPQSGKYVMGPDTKVAQASTPADIEAVRKALNVAGKDPANRDAVRIAKNAIDQFYVDLPKAPGAVVAGDAGGLSDTALTARANTAAAKKAETIQGVDEAADLRSAASHSGANYDNNVRSRLATILLDPKKRRGFSSAELAQMEAIVRGNKVANLSRRVANFMGGGGGLGHMLTTMLGAHVGGPIGAGIASAAGPVLKGIENMAVASKVQKLDEMIRAAAPAQVDAATAARVKYAADKWAAAQTGAKAGDATSLAKLEAASRGLAVVLQRNLGLDAQTMFGKLRELSPANADANGQQNR